MIRNELALALRSLDLACETAAAAAKHLGVPGFDHGDATDIRRAVVDLKGVAFTLVGTDNDTADLAISAAAALTLALDAVQARLAADRLPEPCHRAEAIGLALDDERGSEAASAHARRLLG